MSFRCNDRVCVVNGIAVTDKGSDLPVAVKKAHHRHRYQSAEIIAIIREYVSRVERLDRQVEEAVKKKYSLIHELQTAVNLVYRNIDPLLQHIAGDSLEEKILKAGENIKPLLVSIKLLRSQMELSAVLASPESATFGRRRAKPVYKIFHRTAKLFEQDALLKSSGIVMRGASFATCSLYDSFDNIPLILLSNAVKYSSPSSTIYVEVDDGKENIRATVTSHGPVIRRDEFDSIFQQGYRGVAARKEAATGSGLGLYIAHLIARANGIVIEVDSQPDWPGGTQGVTTFFVYVPRVPPSDR